jgi:hypothetical protein
MSSGYTTDFLYADDMWDDNIEETKQFIINAINKLKAEKKFGILRLTLEHSTA